VNSITKRQAQLLLSEKLLMLEQEDAAAATHPHLLYAYGECVAHGNSRVHCAAKVIDMRVVDVEQEAIMVRIELLGMSFTETWQPKSKEVFCVLVESGIDDALTTVCEELRRVEILDQRDGLQFEKKSKKRAKKNQLLDQRKVTT